MVSVGVVGASGYVGGEILRLLLQHGGVDVTLATSRTMKGEYVFKAHPNLKGFTELKFTDDDPVTAASKVDLLFLSVPHGSSVKVTPEIVEMGTRLIDMTGDFRLKDPSLYPIWYGFEHPAPDLLPRFVYGLPETHREEIRNARFVANPGCIASSTIYSLLPFARSGMINDVTVVDAKTGSSASGNAANRASVYSERYNSIRPYRAAGHRHTAEIEQELSQHAGRKVKVALSAHAVNMVRGIQTTSSVFTDREVAEVDVWKIMRQTYRGEPFVRFIRDRDGVYRLPDPKITVGSNFVDIGFEIDRHTGRVVVISTIDNLIKGAAGNSVHSMNLMLGFPETQGLSTIPLHPA
ncbi:N-acetyl-gamma-glutamyl-phosphate reductase [Thermogymnomonas acidicola]|uniref:Putative [LysW]-L-2-aminoadipate/[LysW]-L-glutamate phosphate reductase n=1 Tax=Thermogymnomonas acidicola TaxID=399579 RepID=A0AA37BS13_9ARCH|nr:N-acetyl-gamma-glutamyl-phosphate reductase [Thermogymnomonas acidicola]GGM75835.1 N-acetyl-gamma-glutamyl-phosphate reductase [Thermogymnomonas acidicola]